MWLFLTCSVKTSGLDVGTILGCLHSGKHVSEEFRPGSYKMTNTFNALLNSFRFVLPLHISFGRLLHWSKLPSDRLLYIGIQPSSLYPLNQRYEHYAAKAIGRYPEDVSHTTRS